MQIFFKLILEWTSTILFAVQFTSVCRNLDNLQFEITRGKGTS